MLSRFWRSKKTDNNQTADQKKTPVALPEALKRTGTRLSQGLSRLLSLKSLNTEATKALEDLLLTADFGADITASIIQQITKICSRKDLNTRGAILTHLKNYLTEMLASFEQSCSVSDQASPFVILVVGINGVGKTTTIGKMARHFQNAGHSVLLAAGDTFRAGAIQQLDIWGTRNQVPVIKQAAGSDSASVIYDAVQAAQARNIDIVIADTAGRLHTKKHLMAELEKIKRVLQKKCGSEYPQEIHLVLDATTGQNALHQAKTFHESMQITGLTVTKLDGTAKGGILFAVSKLLRCPIRFIGVGEQIEDLRPFIAKEFVNALIRSDSEA